MHRFFVVLGICIVGLTVFLTVFLTLNHTSRIHEIDGLDKEFKTILSSEWTKVTEHLENRQYSDAILRLQILTGEIQRSTVSPTTEWSEPWVLMDSFLFGLKQSLEHEHVNDSTIVHKRKQLQLAINYILNPRISLLDTHLRVFYHELSEFIGRGPAIIGPSIEQTMGDFEYSWSIMTPALQLKTGKSKWEQLDRSFRLFAMNADLRAAGELVRFLKHTDASTTEQRSDTDNPLIYLFGTMMLCCLSIVLLFKIKRMRDG